MRKGLLMEKKDLFRKSAMDRVSSPDRLNDYIRLSNPSVWVILAAVLILLVSVFVWGYFGALPTTLTANGVGSGGSIVCFLPLEDAEAVRPGMEASVGSYPAEVSQVGSIPLSAAEAAGELGSDYARASLSLSDWSIRVVLALEEPVEDGQVYAVRITADETRPIDFILN